MFLPYFQPLEFSIGRGNMIIFFDASNGNSCSEILKFLDFVNKRRGGGAPNGKAIINVAEDK